MAQAKRIYIFMIKVNKVVFLFSLWCFLKEIENMFSGFLLSFVVFACIHFNKYCAQRRNVDVVVKN